MSITHVILECVDQEHDGWRQVVEKWSWVGFRPDWKHQTDYNEDTKDFERHYYNIQIKDKKDLVNVAQLIHELNMAYPDIQIEWISKIEEASIGFGTKYSKFVRGHINYPKINSLITQDLNKIKDILRNY